MMTNFLLILPTEKENLENTLRLFPKTTSNRKEIYEDEIQLIIGDFKESNYHFKKENSTYTLQTNLLKHSAINFASKDTSENQIFQPSIQIKTKGKEIKISTDSLGTDFIYFAYHKGKIYLSSHIRYILSAEKEFLKTLEYDALLEYVFSHCILGMKTFFRKIRLLPYNRTIRLNYTDFDDTNADQTILDNSKIAYNFPLDYEKMDNKKYLETVEKQSSLFKEYFSSLLTKHREDNYFLLSGGLDSRTLIASVKDTLRDRCKGITFDYSVKGQNAMYAREVAEGLNIEHIVRIIDEQETIQDSIRHMWFCEGTSTHIASRLVRILDELETKNNLFIDGYVGDGQLGGEFFTCIKNKHLKKDHSLALLNAMKLHNYFFPIKFFEEAVKEKDVMSNIILPELKKHVSLLWEVKNDRMRIETLLALTRGRKYAIGGPKTVENYGITVLPFYHPEIFSTYIKIPYKLREKRNFELDVLSCLNPEIAKISTTSSKFKRLKIVQNALKVVRWIEMKIGMSIIPKSSSPIYKWAKKDSPYYKFIYEILENDNSFIWNILNKDVVNKLYADLFAQKNHLELFLSAFIDLEIVMRLFYGIHIPEKLVLESFNLRIKEEIEPKFPVYDLNDII